MFGNQIAVSDDIPISIHAPVKGATVDLIQRVCDSWKNGEISVGFAKGVVLLTFIGAYGIPAPAELAALQEAVDRVIPCHLASKYLWRWILVREIEGMTLDELQTHKISEFAFEEVQA